MQLKYTIYNRNYVVNVIEGKNIDADIKPTLPEHKTKLIISTSNITYVDSPAYMFATYIEITPEYKTYLCNMKNKYDFYEAKVVKYDNVDEQKTTTSQDIKEEYNYYINLKEETISNVIGSTDVDSKYYNKKKAKLIEKCNEKINKLTKYFKDGSEVDPSKIDSAAINEYKVKAEKRKEQYDLKNIKIRLAIRRPNPRADLFSVAQSKDNRNGWYAKWVKDKKKYKKNNFSYYETRYNNYIPFSSDIEECPCSVWNGVMLDGLDLYNKMWQSPVTNGRTIVTWTLSATKVIKYFNYIFEESHSYKMFYKRLDKRAKTNIGLRRYLKPTHIFYTPVATQRIGARLHRISVSSEETKLTYSDLKKNLKVNGTINFNVYDVKKGKIIGPATEMPTDSVLDVKCITHTDTIDKSTYNVSTGMQIKADRDIPLVRIYPNANIIAGEKLYILPLYELRNLSHVGYKTSFKSNEYSNSLEGLETSTNITIGKEATYTFDDTVNIYKQYLTPKYSLNYMLNVNNATGYFPTLKFLEEYVYFGAETPDPSTNFKLIDTILLETQKRSYYNELDDILQNTITLQVGYNLPIDGLLFFKDLNGYKVDTPYWYSNAIDGNNMRLQYTWTKFLLNDCQMALTKPVTLNIGLDELNSGIYFMQNNVYEPWPTTLSQISIGGWKFSPLSKNWINISNLNNKTPYDIQTEYPDIALLTTNLEIGTTVKNALHDKGRIIFEVFKIRNKKSPTDYEMKLVYCDYFNYSNGNIRSNITFDNKWSIEKDATYIMHIEDLKYHPFHFTWGNNIKQDNIREIFNCYHKGIKLYIGESSDIAAMRKNEMVNVKSSGSATATDMNEVFFFDGVYKNFSGLYGSSLPVKIERKDSDIISGWLEINVYGIDACSHRYGNVNDGDQTYLLERRFTKYGDKDGIIKDLNLYLGPDNYKDALQKSLYINEFNDSNVFNIPLPTEPLGDTGFNDIKEYSAYRVASRFHIIERKSSEDLVYVVYKDSWKENEGSRHLGASIGLTSINYEGHAEKDIIRTFEMLNPASVPVQITGSIDSVKSARMKLIVNARKVDSDSKYKEIEIFDEHANKYTDHTVNIRMPMRYGNILEHDNEFYELMPISDSSIPRGITVYYKAELSYW